MSEDKELAKLKDKLGAARAYRESKKLPERWRQYYNYYIGNHWKSTTDPKHPKIVVNICFNLIDSVLSAMVAQAPTGYVVPVRDDPVDQLTCESLTENVSSWAEESDLQRSLRLGLKNSYIYGTSHFKTWWDRNADGGQGEIRVDAVGPWAIFHEPNATSLRDCEWIIQGTVLSKDKLKRLSGQDFPEQKPPEDLTADADLDVKRQGSTVAYEAWLNGGKEVVWFTDQKVIAKTPNPYQHGGYPYVRLVDTELPDEYEGIGMIDPIISVQREINEIRSDRLIYARLHSYPWIINEVGAVKNRKALSNDPGLILDVQPGMKVERQFPPPMPAHLAGMPEQAIADAERQLGVRDIPQGRKPYGITSGRGMEAVAGAQSQRLEGVKARPLEQAIKEIIRQVVSLMIQFYRGPRMVPFWQDGELVFAGVPERYPDVKFRIRVEPGTTLAINKVARMQLAMQLAAMGLISREEVLRAVEWPRWREVAQEAQQQEQMMAQQQMAMQAQAQSMGLGGGNGGARGAGLPAQAGGANTASNNFRKMNPKMGTDTPGNIGNPVSDLARMPTSSLLGLLGHNARRG